MSEEDKRNQFEMRNKVDFYSIINAIIIIIWLPHTQANSDNIIHQHLKLNGVIFIIPRVVIHIRR